MSDRKRVLFFAEPATLAHVARPTVLAAALDPKVYDVIVATGPDFRNVVADAGLNTVNLFAIGTHAYLQAVKLGKPVYSFKVLQDYVDDDLRLIREFRPALIVGDFRLSLAVSARLAATPYWLISNAYWSPLTPVHFDLPVHRSTRLLGVNLARNLFGLLRPLIFAHHSMPMHRLRRKHGQPSLGFDVRRIFSEADRTLFADVPDLVPTGSGEVRNRYTYIGPITWSPGGKLPDELMGLSNDRPLVYVGLGSSGDPTVLDKIIGPLLSLGCRVAISVGSDFGMRTFPKGVFVARYLPGDVLCRMSRFVICNGGSPSVHQALEHGVPVLGIPANLDQLINMQFVVSAGAGLSLRADCVTRDSVAAMARCLLEDEALRTAAERISRAFGRYDAQRAFRTMVAVAL